MSERTRAVRAGLWTCLQAWLQGWGYWHPESNGKVLPWGPAVRAKRAAWLRAIGPDGRRVLREAYKRGYGL